VFEPAGPAATWTEGGTTNLTLTAANWDANTLPGGGAALTFGDVSPIGTVVVWDFANGFNPNIPSRWNDQRAGQHPFARAR